MFLVLVTNNIFSQNSEFDKLMQQDWANLQKYRSENKKLQDGKVEPLVVFMGNSITEGWVRESPEFF